MGATSGHPTTQPYSRAGLLAKLTGAATLALGAMLYGNGTSQLATLAHPGTAGEILISATGANRPAWSGSGLTYAGGVLTVVGSAPASALAGEIKAGGGTLRVGTAAIFGTDPGGSETLRVGGGLRCTTVTASGLGLFSTTTPATALRLSATGGNHAALSFFENGVAEVSWGKRAGGAMVFNSGGNLAGTDLLSINVGTGAATFNAGITCTTVTASAASNAIHELLNRNLSTGASAYSQIVAQGDGTRRAYFGVVGTGNSGLSGANTAYIGSNGTVFFIASDTVAGAWSTTGLAVGATALVSSERLRVAGQLRVGASGVNSIFDSAAASDARMEFHRNGVRQGLFAWDTATLTFEGDSTAGSAVKFRTGGSDRMTITSAGAVVIGTDPGGSQLVRVGGSFACTGGIVASGATDIISARGAAAATARVAIGATDASDTNGRLLLSWDDAANSAGINSYKAAAYRALNLDGSAVALRSGTTERFKVDATGIGFFSATPVARPSLAAATGTATRTTFDTATVTTQQLAERVKALIDDWRGYGLGA